MLSPWPGFVCEPLGPAVAWITAWVAPFPDDAGGKRNRAMRGVRRPKFFGYVKVSLISRSPRRWGWSIHSDGVESHAAVEAEHTYRSAEDAWRDGRKALAALEDGILTGARRPLGAAA